MTLHVEDPDGEILGDQFAMDFEAGRPPGSVAGQEQRITLALGTRLTFASTGPHAVVVRVGDTNSAGPGSTCNRFHRNCSRLKCASRAPTRGGLIGRACPAAPRVLRRASTTGTFRV